MERAAPASSGVSASVSGDAAIAPAGGLQEQVEVAAETEGDGGGAGCRRTAALGV